VGRAFALSVEGQGSNHGRVKSKKNWHLILPWLVCTI